MSSVSPLLVGAASLRARPRSAEEYGLLVTEMQASPDEWFVFGIYGSRAAARIRASECRTGRRLPEALLPYHQNLDWKHDTHDEYGWTAQVRWRSTPS